MSLLRTESYKKGIALSVGFNFLAKAFSFVTSLFVAYYFGTAPQVDVYMYAFLAVTIVTAFISSLNSAVLIPEAMRLEAQEGRERSEAFLNLFLYAYAALSLALAAAALVNPVRAALAVSRFDPLVLEQNAAILNYALPLLPLILVSTYLVDILASKKFFAVPMLASMANSLFALAFVVALHGRLGVSSILLGLNLAFLAQTAFLLLLMKSALGWNFSFRPFKLGHKLWRDILYAQLGNLSSSLSAYAPIFMLSGLGAGAVSAMNYGRQVSEFPNAFVTTQFSAVAGIKMNELFARGNTGEMNRIFVSTSRLLLFLLTPVSLAVFFFPDWLMTVLFRRGSFDAESVRASAGFLKLFILLLPLYALNTLMARLFMATQQIARSFWYQVAFSAALAALIYFFVGAFGGRGYPAALLVMYTANLAAFAWLARLYFKWLTYGPVLAYGARLLALDAALAAPALLLYRALPSGLAAFNPVLAVAFYLLLVVAANRLLRLCPEANELLLAARDRLFRKG